MYSDDGWNTHRNGYWSTFGDYLEGSGWTAALIQAGVASSGTAESFLRASHLTKTR